jgi:hypothetical protein
MIVLALAAVAVLSQGPDFTWSGDVGAGKRVTVKNVIGDIRIEPASGATATVTGVKRAGRHGDPKEVEIRQVAGKDGPVFCVVYPGSDGDCGGGRGEKHEENDTRVDFTIRLPAGAALAAMTVSGDVLGHGIRGSAEVRSVSGDVSLSDVTGDLVEGRSVSGDVRLEKIAAGEVVAESVSGDLLYSGEIRGKGSYDFKTVSGDVTLEIPGGAGAEVSGSTFSGDVRSGFALKGEGSQYGSRQRIRGTIGDGSARIRFESLSGDLSLREAGKK